MELRAEYAKFAAEHGAASEEGDSEAANRAFEKLVAVYRALRNLGETGQNVVAGLMEHESPSVRGWAAAHSLKSHEDKAIATLENLSDGVGAVAFTAEIVLGEWRNGTLEVSE